MQESQYYDKVPSDSSACAFSAEGLSLEENKIAMIDVICDDSNTHMLCVEHTRYGSVTQ